MEKAGWFDAQAFYAALDAERTGRRLNWKQVAKESGISASTLTRLAQGKRPDVDSLAALLAWSKLDPDQFVRSRTGPGAPQPLAMISTFLRSDPHLTPEAASALEAIIKAAYEELRQES